ncbi:uncharacterized protein LOC110847044 [Folsomia candida]|uniref:Uncharacterized protein n=1 Tax=Folsomia candida TaxID=158441 RepID=A0A226EM81_FOLCA|nr:uncharacterized protein LOC110847044 [Folsomia candida]OXA58257.1 hypothetical protein Fcan01_08505 [Folsomia candida]
MSNVSLSTDSNSHVNPTLHYILSVPGWLRITNLALGLLCIILSSIGHSDDFRGEGEAWVPYVYYYGLGYNEERANVWSLIVICVCFTTSSVFLLLLLSTAGAVKRWRAWNRFLNLSLAFLLLTGWISGLLGFLLFRQGCCRVEVFGTERITHELDGYAQACLCLINPHNDPDRSYPVLLYQDAPTGIQFVKVQPHHANAHITNLISMLINVIVYFVAAFKV